MASLLKISVYGSLFCLLISCSEKKEHVQLFYGACKLSVSSSDKKDAIYVDGIKVGKGNVELDVPCGHRQVRAARDHHVDHQEYVELFKGKPVDLKLQPKALGDVENYALSNTLIERLRQGKSPVVEKNIEKPADQSAEPESKEEKAADDWS